MGVRGGGKLKSSLGLTLDPPNLPLQTPTFPYPDPHKTHISTKRADTFHTSSDFLAQLVEHMLYTHRVKSSILLEVKLLLLLVPFNIMLTLSTLQQISYEDFVSYDFII